MYEPTACQIIGRWVSEVTIENIPDEVLQAAMQSWVDVLGCMLGGATINASKKLRTLILSQHGKGDCWVAGSKNTCSSIGAAMANGTSAHALDFDDTSYAGVVHASATVAAAVMAAADHVGADGATTFTAFIAGSEAEYAYGKAASNQLFMDGWWTTSVFGGLGAAAGAAKVMGLNEDETNLAIAHALCRVSGLRVANGTDAKFVGNGQVASLGVTSAHFAEVGLSAPLDALEGQNGMAQLIKRGPLNLAPLKDLGTTWSFINPGVYLKPYPACSASHAAAEAAIEIIKDHDLTADDIATIQVEAPQIVIDSLVYNDPNRAPQGQFSLPFIIACVIVDRGFGLERINEDSLNDPRIRALMPKITLHHDVELTQKSLAGEVGPECARVRLTTSKNEELKKFNSEAIGAPTKPMSNQQVDDKFLNLANYSGNTEHAAMWLQRIRNILEINQIRNLWCIN